eukprot:m.42655 g.42655  ORF g.42655 m.42655 type:complete len:215 (-) comp10723_c0_seq2:1425-2069(-)
MQPFPFPRCPRPRAPVRTQHITMSKRPLVELSRSAYAKAVAHAAKFPDNAVNGVVIGTVEGSRVTVQDALPLMHTHLQLSMLVEAAMTQAVAYAESKQLQVVGYYHASKIASQMEMDTITKTIAERIREAQPNCVVLMLNGTRLASASDTALFDLYTPAKEAGKWVQWYVVKGIVVDQKQTVRPSWLRSPCSCCVVCTFQKKTINCTRFLIVCL